MKFLERILGDPNKKALKQLEPIVARVNSFESEIEKLTDDELKSKTDEFRGRIDKGESLDDLLPEVFAVVRETARRVLGERAFDTQIMGGIVLHQGKISEMKTGEGKTLAATMPVYLNALTGKGVHVITVNDYLANRDAEWMGQIYEFLGLTVAAVTHDLPASERKDAYAADITYGTNNEFGFDYLRDHMAPKLEAQVQRELNFVVVDEVDSILIDEARTPLIISAPAEESTEKYKQFAKVVPQLTVNIDYTVDEKVKTAILTESGIDKIQNLLGIKDIYESGDIVLAHHIEQALRAHAIYKKDVDYVVKDGEVMIVDEFTGRMMPGRRYSEGLHQAIEAKERVEVKRESKTFATITFQNLFRLYDKLSGMTGTAKTEEEEFWKIYGLEVVVLPTNRPLVRDDMNDLVYVNERAKFNAVVKEIQARYKKGQPVLVGTIAIEKSEVLSAMLKQVGVPHNVLNAKQHEREADIVKNAGQKQAITIATNMAGRGTDIKLGEGVIEVGGLHILGTERHESRRIDNQLRGRAGRQGDPGSTQFFVSAEDDLMRLFGSEKMQNMMKTLKMPEDQPLEHKWISGSIESAQKRVEGHNFDIRKRVVEYDDVMNRHRETIYKQRQAILEQEDVREDIQKYLFDELRGLVAMSIPDDKQFEDREALVKNVQTIMLLREDILARVKTGTRDEVSDILVEEAKRQYEVREQEVGGELLRQMERAVLLRVMDLMWMEHLDAMVRLREVIGLRGYGQRDPLAEYKQEAYEMFQKLQAAIAGDVARMIFKVKIQVPSTESRESLEIQAKKKFAEQGMQNSSPSLAETVPSKQVKLQGGTEPTGDFKDEEAELRSAMKNEKLRMKNAQKEEESDSPTKGDSLFSRDNKTDSPTDGGDTFVSAVRDPNEKKEKVGRNDPCPCGATNENGKPIKYKRCHGA